LKETTMSTLMEDDIKRWTAKRKTALVLDIIQGKTTISEASRAFDLSHESRHTDRQPDKGDGARVGPCWA
jgi:transposase-like protein